MSRSFRYLKTTKAEVPCHSRCGTIKIPPCSKALSAEHRPKFCNPLPAMMTFLCQRFLRRAFVCFYLLVKSQLSNFSAIYDLDLCLALMFLALRVLFRTNSYCDTGPRFVRSHPKDRHPRPTLGFELGKQGSPDLCASAGSALSIPPNLISYMYMYTSSTTCTQLDSFFYDFKQKPQFC
jgi:hypothetical protein